MTRWTLLAFALALGSATPPELLGQVSGYEAATAGTRMLRAENGLSIRVLVDAATLGGSEVEIGEITFPAGSGGGGASGHRHGSVEIFYILSGEFDHVVNGVHHVLTPGMVGIVRPGDSVVHTVLSAEPVRALVIWAPGGEVERIAPFFEETPIPQQ